MMNRIHESSTRTRAYQQFGGEDSAVRAEQELLERHGDEALLFSWQVFKGVN